GPPGVGKTILCRYFASLRAKEKKNKSFFWLTMDESIKPSHFIGSFYPLKPQIADGCPKALPDS
ncbi:unnamed protein product, partial [marine sediment metagenome]